MMTYDPRLLVLILAPFVAAIVGYRIGKVNKLARDYFADIVVVCMFALVVGMFQVMRTTGIPYFRIEGISGLNFYLKLDGFREIYCVIASFIWMMTTLISREYFHHYHNRNRYYAFVLPTYGATLGVFLSADLFTTFLFFQILSITVFVGIAHDEKDTAVDAATTYIAAELAGGLLVLSGLFRLYTMFGTLEIDKLRELVEAAPDKFPIYVAGVMLFLGFGAKAGMFPLHFWMPRAHAASPAPISTLLSSIITKTGVFGVIVVCGNIFFDNKKFGIFVLILGTFTMLLGAVRAIFDVHMKRILAFSSLSQIGFILVGVGAALFLGEENQLAAQGAILHMVNHSFLKLVLYLTAAIIYMKLHGMDLNLIRGYGHGKPLLHFAYLMGAMGLAGIPRLNGYVSKTLLHESIVEAIHEVGLTSGTGMLLKTIEILFLFAGGITFAYMTKLYICIFHEKHPEKQEAYNEKNGHYMGKMATVTLIAAALVPPVLGFEPSLILDRLGRMGMGILTPSVPEHAVHYFAWENLKGGLISIVIGILLYVFFVRKVLMRKNENGVLEYVYLWPQWLDAEYLLYRPFIFIIIPHFCAIFAHLLDRPIFLRWISRITWRPKWWIEHEKKRELKYQTKKDEKQRKKLHDTNKYR